MTAIHWAALKGHSQAAEMLLEARKPMITQTGHKQTNQTSQRRSALCMPASPNIRQYKQYTNNNQDTITQQQHIHNTIKQSNIKHGRFP